MRVPTLLILLSLVVVPVHVIAGEKLTGEEIQSTFEGNTYHWKHATRDDFGKNFLDSNGKTMGTKNGEPRKGGWSIKGDQMCFKGKKTLCRDVQKDGDLYYLLNGNKRVVEITKIESGNTI